MQCAVVQCVVVHCAVCSGALYSVQWCSKINLPLSLVPPSMRRAAKDAGVIGSGAGTPASGLGSPASFEVSASGSEGEDKQKHNTTHIWSTWTVFLYILG